MSERDETLPTPEIGVFEETAPLREVALWGEPGCETILGQLLPESKSLFFKRFNVAQARDEFRRMQGIFEANGVKVIRIKDLASQFPERSDGRKMPRSLTELSTKIKERGREIYLKYGLGSLDVLDIIDPILGEEAEQYGEKEAIRLNYALSLKHQIPLADIYFGRDQTNTVGDTILLSRMRWPIRKSEVAIYRKAYQELGLGSRLIELPQGYIEGGDIILWRNTCFIGVGVRTNRQAVIEIYNRIGRKLKNRGIDIAVVVSPRQASLKTKTPGEEMGVMHLDTFCMPLDKETILASGEEISQRRIETIIERNGELNFRDMGRFDQFLGRKGIEVINITAQEQRNYSTNFVHLGHGKVIVPLSENKRVIDELTTNGLTVIPTETTELVGGYGAVHCMAAPLRRG